MKNNKLMIRLMILLIMISLASFFVTAAYPSCCCLTSSVSIVYDSSDYINCYRQGGQVNEGAASSQQDCLSTCGSNICVLCKSGSCSDYDTCTDNSAGGLCSTGSSCCSGTCTLRQGPGQGCELFTLAIRPDSATRGTDLGFQRITLSWNDNINCPVNSYDIFRCSGSTCTSYTSIYSTTQKSYIDTSIQFGTYYRYIIQANYPAQGPKNSSVATFYSGDAECLNRNEAKFCYNNQPYHCDAFNKLVAETACPSGQFCTGGRCTARTDCTTSGTEVGFTFGLGYDITNCEGTSSSSRYCFLDKSSTNVDMCYSCGGDSMKCYDYRSKSSCERDNCQVGTLQNSTSCRWKDTYPELGLGVCIDEQADNCGFCKSKGTSAMTNINFGAYNDIFDIYSSKKLEALSTALYPCFESNNTCISCGDSGCSLYNTQSKCTNLTGSGLINLNDNNDFTSSSSDSCSVNVCRWIDNRCQKDADGVPLADCSGQSSSCEKDYFRPNTTISFSTDSEGIVSAVYITVSDKTFRNESYSPRSSGNYTTYYCIVGNGNPCTARTNYFKSTTSRTLAIGKYNNLTLKLCSGTCTSDSFTLVEGNNLIKFYSEDPSHNLGLVQQMNFSASTDIRPVPVAYVENAYYDNNIFYTNSKNPVIKINFSNSAKLISYSLEDSSGNKIILPPLDFSLRLSHTINPTNLNDGLYKFYFLAENEYGKRMSANALLSFVVDTVRPTVIVKPGNNNVSNKSTVEINLTFNEKALLNKIYLDNVDVTSNFTSSDKMLFKASFGFAEGIHTINLADAEDYAGNNITAYSSFEVNSRSLLDIRLVKPKYGVSSTYEFNLTLSTDNTANCRYSKDNDRDTYDTMSLRDATNSTIHVLPLTFTDTLTHIIYVQCKDSFYNSITSKQFNLAVDVTPPNISAYFKSQVVTTSAELQVTTDDYTICNYSSVLGNDKFVGYDNLTFDLAHNVTIFPPIKDEKYNFTVECMNLAELTNKAYASFTINASAPLIITSTTKNKFTSTSIDLKVNLNIDSDCKYTLNPDSQIGSWIPMLEDTPTDRRAPITVAGNDHYKYYVKCFKNDWVGTMGNSSPVILEFDVDITPPYMIYVNDSSSEANPEFTWRTDQLRVSWLGKDNETDDPVVKYYYTLKKFGSTSSSDILINWSTDTHSQEWITLTKASNGSNFNLTDKQKYQFDVKPENLYGAIGSQMSSNGITIDATLRPAHCNNSIKDDNETDVDCGDGCTGCNITKSCLNHSDCLPELSCLNKICRATSCSDSIKNGEESDVDCGGNCSKKCDNGKTCNGKDNNCVSGYCNIATGKCETPSGTESTCRNGKKDSGETGVDCGGTCAGCSEGGFCTSANDCSLGLQCISGVCRKDTDGDSIIDINDNCPTKSNFDQVDTDGDGKGDECDDDIDGDGLTNGFEDLYGFNKYEVDSDQDGITDDQQDNDNDQLINIEEQNNGPGYCLSPLLSDSDNDGWIDKDEIDKGTDPCDATSKPKSSWWIWLLVLLLFILLGLLYYYGYPKYQEYVKKQKKTTTVSKALPLPPLGRQMPPNLSAKQPAGYQRPMMYGKNINRPLTEAEKKRIEMEQKRKSLFSTFLTEEKTSEKKAQPVKPSGLKSEENKEDIKEWIMLGAKPKQPVQEEKKGDVFGKLKEITKNQNEMKKEVFKKLEDASKKKETQIKVVPVIIKKSVPKKVIQVVSTKEGTSYHKTGCITIKGKTNIVTYKNEEEAKKKGLDKCHVCFPKTKEKQVSKGSLRYERLPASKEKIIKSAIKKSYASSQSKKKKR